MLSMPKLSHPGVYNSTAVPRDLEAGENNIDVEGVEIQTRALRQVKELAPGVTASSSPSPSKDSFGALAFNSSSRYRNGLFAKNNDCLSNAASFIMPDRESMGVPILFS
ncbi:hypothetical protein GGS24DRAFT_287136 [Hypoxylon argillaceum]|nr:hypothetical protein GGS24DRAFT_287136 [Hypoxylon argillaceum]